MEGYDVIVVGSGPGGSSTALHAARRGYRVLVLDKHRFPRDKTCGDGISGKSVKLLEELGLREEVEKNEHAEMKGVVFSNPKGTEVEIEAPQARERPAGYVVRRYVFDNILHEAVKREKNVDVIDGAFVYDVVKEEGKVVGVKAKVDGEEKVFKAPVVVGADGASSIIATKVGAEKIEDAHHVIAVRAYFDRVKGMRPMIELHFIDEVLPGYFWIFPLPDGRANVGVGMLTKDLKERKVDLKKVLVNAINSPRFKDRFLGSTPIDPVTGERGDVIKVTKGWGLPLGSKRRKGYGDGYLLVGDAAALIDPFTGEGIGNALLSGKLAAETIDRAFKEGSFGKETLSYYDELLKKNLDEELQLMYKLQRLGRFKTLLNLVIDKAAKNEELRRALSMTLIEDEKGLEHRKKLLSPLFWLKVFLS